MLETLKPTQEPGWVLSHEGYSILSESAVESRFALGNGFLGMRAARSVSRGPTWVAWLGYIRWASWPRCYVAGLFDMPNTEPPVPALVPVADWSRVRILLDGEPLLAREGEVLLGTRTLDMRRGVLLSAWTHRTPAGITASGQELRLLSQADRAVGLQLLQFSMDRDGVDVRLEASFALAGLGMEPMLLEQDLGAWRTEGADRGVAMTGAAALRLDGDLLEPDRPFPLRWAWGWRSVAGQVAEFDRLVAVARSDMPEHDPAPPASAALARNYALGWRAVLAAHEVAWNTRWIASDVLIEGDDESQQALRFAIYHLTSAANPDDDHVSIGARALTGDAYLGHVFWDTETYLLPFYTAVWPEAARALLMYRFHTLPGARAKAAHFGFKGALYAWESADTGVETTPERVVVSEGTTVEILTGRMEHHISADVAYAVWQYWRFTGDDDFFLHAGGVRIAGLGALWQAVILGFAGLDLKGGMLGVDPRLPPQWRSLSFRVCWRGQSVAIRITDGIVQATLVEGEGMGCGSELRRAHWRRAQRCRCRCRLRPPQFPPAHLTHRCRRASRRSSPHKPAIWTKHFSTGWQHC